MCSHDNMEYTAKEATHDSNVVEVAGKCDECGHVCYTFVNKLDFVGE